VDEQQAPRAAAVEIAHLVADAAIDGAEGLIGEEGTAVAGDDRDQRLDAHDRRRRNSVKHEIEDDLLAIAATARGGRDERRDDDRAAHQIPPQPRQTVAQE
jgi:hypothetical protein